MSGWKLPIYAFLLMAVIGVHGVFESPWLTLGGAALAAASAVGVYRYEGAR